MIEPYYTSERVTLYHADCREVIAQIGTEGIAAVVTDPPYGIGWSRQPNPLRLDAGHDGIVGDENTSVRDETLGLLCGLPVAAFGSFSAPAPIDVRQTLVWHKPPDTGVTGACLGYRRDVDAIYLIGPWPARKVSHSAVLRSHKRGQAHIVRTAGHPHAKPVDVLMQLMDFAPSGTILDPFCGSGSTGIAALRLGRRVILCEIDEQYCHVAARRLQAEEQQTELFD